MSGREDIVRRIRQLREKTADRGCSEAEALAAAAKAAELMAKHGLGEDDLVIEEAPSTFRVKSHSALRRLWAIVALCTNTCGLNAARTNIDVIVFVGVAPGPEIAVYLRELLSRAVRKELAAFKVGTFYRRRRSTATRKAAVADFLDALVGRLGARLLELFQDSRSDECRERAVAHVDAKYRTTNVDFKTRQTRFGDAAWEGHRAGNRVNISHGVSENGRERLRIGTL